MTLSDYERQGGFRAELVLLRDIGLKLTTLMEALPARPHREPELEALRKLEAANNRLREEIVFTRKQSL